MRYWIIAAVASVILFGVGMWLGLHSPTIPLWPNGEGFPVCFNPWHSAVDARWWRTIDADTPGLSTYCQWRNGIVGTIAALFVACPVFVTVALFVSCNVRTRPNYEIGAR